MLNNGTEHTSVFQSIMLLDQVLFILDQHIHLPQSQVILGNEELLHSRSIVNQIAGQSLCESDSQRIRHFAGGRMKEGTVAVAIDIILRHFAIKISDHIIIESNESLIGSRSICQHLISDTGQVGDKLINLLITGIHICFKCITILSNTADADNTVGKASGFKVHKKFHIYQFLSFTLHIYYIIFFYKNQKGYFALKNF